ncbi:MAG: hypothetical protein J6W50_02395 [Bacteroidaceae bacterium]|nr:hypothetical protein [Bacteroidaceae bacterium]
MKRLIVLLLIASGQFPMVNYVCAENYGIKVGGVEVTSSNYNNITGDHIKALYSADAYSVKYNPSTKTLTLVNADIQRDGDGNRAIHNYGCDGLTIIFYKECHLFSHDSNPLKIDKNTTIKSREIYGALNSQTEINGGYNAGSVYISDGATLKFDSASVKLGGGYASSAVEGQKGTEKIEITNSYIVMESVSTGAYEGTYVLRDIGSLMVSNSTVSLDIEADKTPVYNLKSFTKSGNVNVLTSGITPAVYNSSQKTFVYSDEGSVVPKHLKIAVSVAIDETNFGELRGNVSNYDKNNNGFLEYSNTGFGAWEDETLNVTELSTRNKSGLKGLSYLSHLQKLTCTEGSLTSVDLTQNKELTEINLSGNALTSLKMPAGVKILDCSNNQFTSLDLSSYTELTKIICTQNQLTTLKVSPLASKLSQIYCDLNHISGDGLTSLVNCLPQRLGDAHGSLYVVNHAKSGEDNGFTAAQVVLAKEREWDLKHYTGASAGWTTVNECCKYDLWVGGNRLVYHNLKGTHYEYQPATMTLEISNITIDGTGSVSDADHAYGRAIQSRIDGLTIDIKGNVFVNAAADDCIGVMLSGNTTIAGYGIFAATGKVGIQAYNSSLTVRGDITVKSEGTSCGINAAGPTPGSLTVKNNATLMGLTTTGSDRSGIESFSALILENNRRITTPIGAYWQNQQVVDRAGRPVAGEWVTIGPLLKGDVNHDSNINTADVVAIYSFIENGESSGFLREDVDVNGDSSVNTADVVKVYDAIINGSGEE